jgi:hypothetical protein
MRYVDLKKEHEHIYFYIETEAHSLLRQTGMKYTNETSDMGLCF